MQGAHQESNLHRCLSGFDLTLFGIGAIIGAGIFVLTGIAAATQAGPAIMFSYALAGVACAFSALCYAELAASIGGCGSAYHYAYVGLGEFIAWIIGWQLILEYSLATSTVAIGWAGYVRDLLSAIGINVPNNLMHGPFNGGIVDLPAVLIIAFITFLMCLGVRKSAWFNTIIVGVKLAAILLFSVIATMHFDIKNWHPFLPFGFQGIINGAALIFFAYIGFDAVSTAAEETINPQRNMPIGILASLAICTVIYIIVSGLLTGVASYTTLNVSSPISNILLALGMHVASAIIAVGAIAGLTTVILVMFYGLTRVLLAMSRDCLLPNQLSVISEKRSSPIKLILAVGFIMMIIAGFAPIHSLAALVNIGTLSAFALVCLGVIILRKTKPELPRPFKVPATPLVPACGILLCLYLMFSLSGFTWVCFLIWMMVGLCWYFIYGQKHSRLNND